MDTSPQDNNSDIVSSQLETLILASIQTLKRRNKKCGNEEVFELVLESLDNPIDRNYFDETIETLIQNRKIKSSCYANKSCLSLTKQLEANVENSENDNTLGNDFDNFKNVMLKEFESIKSAFFKEVNSFKNRILDTCDDCPHLQSKNDKNINNTLNVLERLITHLEGQVSTLKVQLDRKDSIINILLEKLEKHDNVEAHKCQCERNNLSVSQSTSATESESATQVKLKNVNNISPSETNERTSLEKPNKPTTEISNLSEDNPATILTPPRNNENESENESNITQNSITEDPKQSSKTSKSVVILGDSMTKHTNGWEISKKIKSKCKVYAKSFPGATTQCMADYMKPSIRAKPDHIIVHVGTNDLCSNASPNEIATNIVKLTTEMKTDKCDVSISGIIIRTDKPDLNRKGLEVNVILKQMCEEKNIFFIDHCKKIKANHLNSSKLYLNRKGDIILNNIFVQHITKICN